MTEQKTTHTRSRLKALLVTVIAMVPVATSLQAQDYPSRPITMFIGYGAGGQTDLVGRGVARVLSDQLGVPVNVVNRPGSGGALAASQLQRAAPDGYSMLFQTDNVINIEPFTSSRITFAPDDFTYAGMVTAFQQGLAAPKDAPYDTIAEFVDWARENPGACVDAPCLASIIFDFRRGLRSDVCQASECGLL